MGGLYSKEKPCSNAYCLTKGFDADRKSTHLLENGFGFILAGLSTPLRRTMLKQNSSAYKVALMGVLFALAIALSWLEGIVAPMLGLLPGIKLGLANVVVLYALLFLSRRSAAVLVLLKAVFALLTRGGVAALLSLCGGAASLLIMLLLLVLQKKPSIILLSIFGALSHNVGQLLAARLMLGPLSLYYAPVLLLCGIVMGVLTSLVLRALLPPLSRMTPTKPQHTPKTK